MSYSAVSNLTVRGAIAASLFLLAACGRDEITAPAQPVAGTITVDASKGWVYLSLADEAVVTPADPLASEQWDLAFDATNVRLNGGEGGIAGVAGYCLCQNSSANPSTEQILAMTPESELADFERVDASAIPAAAAFVTDRLSPVITGWFSGSGAAATPADAAWLVRLRDSTHYAKLRIAAIEGATAASPGRVTLEFATQPSSTGALGEVRSLTVEVPESGAVGVDLIAGAATGDAAAWDLRLEGWTIRVNGGASGPGKAGAFAAEQPFDEITDAFAGDARAYRTDRYAGVFSEHPWYRYNLLGDHRISPIFDVYLVRRGDVVYKVQIIDYYGPAGEERRVTLRYERIAG